MTKKTPFFASQLPHYFPYETINRYCIVDVSSGNNNKTPFLDAVPPEVREWLASTFTRQLVTTRKRTEEKPKFRTVAHAIRAGK